MSVDVREPTRAHSRPEWTHHLATTYRRWIVAALWIVAIAVCLALCMKRYNASMASARHDFYEYFLPAGELVRQGLSPYSVDGYVYSVLPAAVIAVIAETANPGAWWILLNIGAGFLAICLIVAALWDLLSVWQRPLTFGGTAVALLYNKTTTLMLYVGQVEFLVLMGLALGALTATRKRTVSSGLAIAWTGLMKTWPTVIGVWLLRRGAPHRRRSAAAAAALFIATLVASVAVLGPAAVTGWVHNVLAMRSQPMLIRYSVSGLGSSLFADAAGPLNPLVHSPVLALAVDVAAPAFVAALVAWCLLHPGDDALSLWHVTALVVLLLPVSHSTYLLFLTPLAVIWAARAMAGRDRHRSIPLAGGWAVWWFLVARAQWDGDMNASMPTSAYVVIMAVTLAMVTWSVVAESRPSQRAATHAPAPGSIDLMDQGRRTAPRVNPPAPSVCLSGTSTPPAPPRAGRSAP